MNISNNPNNGFVSDPNGKNSSTKPEVLEAIIIDADHTFIADKGYERFGLVLQVKGQYYQKFYHLATKRALHFMLQELKKLDIIMTGTKDYDKACGELIGRKIRVAIVQAEGLETIYILGSAEVPMDNRESIWE